MANRNQTRKTNSRKARPLRLKRVVEVRTFEGQPSQIYLDGISISGSRLETTSLLGFPFDLIKLDGELSFDTEVWINGHLKLLMPAKTGWTSRVVELMEANLNPLADLEIPKSEEGRLSSIESLRGELALHQGFINHIEWERLGRMYALHSLNYQDLKDYLGNVLTEEIFISEIISQSADPQKREQHLTRIDQKIQNFLASSTSLKLQGLTLMDTYKDTEFGRKFKASMDEMEETGAVQFVRGLRNLQTHQTLLFTEQSWTMTTVPELHHFEIGFSKNELLKFRDWKPAAQALIDGSKDRVNVLTTFIDVFCLEKRQWPWVIAQAAQLNKIHRELANEVGTELAWMQSLGHTGRPRREWARDSGRF